MISVILVCAGSGERAKLNKNKLLFTFNGKTVFEHTIEKFINHPQINEIVVAVSNEAYVEFCEIVYHNDYKNVVIIEGGKTRTESVKNALEKVKGEIVLIHDGARPFVTNKIIDDCIFSVNYYGSGITAVPSVDTLAYCENDLITATHREGFFKIQTPQGFFTEDIKKAYAQIEKGESFTDDSAVYSKFIKPAHLCQGSNENIKLTYPEDFEKLSPPRIGEGFDLHKLVEGRKLILGGIEIPHHKGLLGHSDADVLTHAIMDAILSACSLRDIGYHFPDTDPKYKGISSIKLLERVLNLIDEEGYKVCNVSAVIMAEKPKLMSFIPKISTFLSEIIHIPPTDLGITCTTLEGIGIVGREEGIAVRSSVIVKKYK